MHTEGRYIVDANGQRVKLAAVNWYGAEEKDFVVAGLDDAPLADIAHRIRAMGFNAVRLPWSNQMYETNPPVAAARLAANPPLEGLRALNVFDAVVGALAAEGLYVILDNHMSNADWCCSGTDGNGAWFNAAYPESSWIADWQGMATRYAAQSAVIGADLRNEPRGPVWGGSNPLTDWHAAAQRGGNAVLAANPNLLIFVEGINYASDLTGVKTLPVILSMAQRVVYSSHDYSWFHSGVGSYGTLKSQLDAKWGFLLDANAPVWVGEFGTCHTSATCIASTTPSDSGFWFAGFERYLQERDLDWSYWALNGTEASGTSRTLGAEETFGVLNENWSGAASAALLNVLQAVSAVAVAPVVGGVVNGATFQPGTPLAPGSLASIFGSNLAPVTVAANAAPAPVGLGGVTVQMNSGAAAPILYASPGQVNVQIPWEADPATTTTLRVTVGTMASNDAAVQLAAAAPVIFAASPGDSQGAVLIANTGTLASPARPARPGELVSIFCTGLGAVTNRPATGAAAVANPLSWTNVPPTVSIGGVDARVTFSGLAPGLVGVYQVDVEVPGSVAAGDRVAVQVTTGGTASNVATIAVAQ